MEFGHYVAESNCVVVRRGEEQLEAKSQSVGNEHSSVYCSGEHTGLYAKSDVLKEYAYSSEQKFPEWKETVRLQ